MRKAIAVALYALTLASCSVRSRGVAPAPIYPIPTEAQMNWQKLETYAFVHFGLNTYNDLEWGYGNTSMSTFAPDTLDVEQWVKTFKRAGMKGVILTAKHHDGFCLWPTKTTEYSVSNSPWQGGRGDLVRDLSEACHRHGLLFGLYLSPWDRNHKDYGCPEYQRIFHEQIKELTTGYGKLFEYWFDGANGGTGWYGGADEARAIDPESYYKYEEAAKLLRTNNPDIMIFGGTVPTIRWIGNESGWAGQTNYSTYDFAQESHYRDAQWGMRGAQHWLPGEVDVSIRPGWFYHQREDHQVRTVADLTNLYYQSVGRNANLLLNFPIALDGRIPRTDSINAVHWYEHIRRSFAHNLLGGAKVEAQSTRAGRAFRPKHLTDGSPETYWAAPDGTTTAEIVVSIPRTRLNNIALQEYIRLGQRVDAFTLETRDNAGQWRPIDTRDSLTTIGYKRIIRLAPVETDGIRLRITQARAPVCLAEISAFLVPELVEPPKAQRNAEDMLVIAAAMPENKLRYRIGKGSWRAYTEPVQLPGDHLTLEAEAFGENGQAATTQLKLGYSARSIEAPGLTPEQRTSLLDGDGYTPVDLERAEGIILAFPNERPISRVVYTPNQHRDAGGHIQRYALYVDDQLVAQGEFANIKHNPIPVAIELSPAVRGTRIRLVPTSIVDDKPCVSIGSLAVH